MKLNAFSIALLSAGLAAVTPVSAAWQPLNDGVDTTSSRATSRASASSLLLP